MLTPWLKPLFLSSHPDDSARPDTVITTTGEITMIELQLYHLIRQTLFVLHTLRRLLKRTISWSRDKWSEIVVVFQTLNWCSRPLPTMHYISRRFSLVPNQPSVRYWTSPQRYQIKKIVPSAISATCKLLRQPFKVCRVVGSVEPHR